MSHIDAEDIRSRLLAIADAETCRPDHIFSYVDTEEDAKYISCVDWEYGFVITDINGALYHVSVKEISRP